MIKYPQLKPLVDDWINQFLENKELINSAFNQYGSPINIHFLEPFIQNYHEYLEVLQNHKLDHLVFYARKANKSKCFVKSAATQQFGVDTASFNELNQSLEIGVPSDRLVVTAAVKTEELIQLALEHHVLIIVDNQDELAHIEMLCLKGGHTAQLGVRISGFDWNGQKLYSRFGFDITSALAVVKEIHSNKCFDFKGFHFHLNGYSIDQRVQAILQTLDLSELLAQDGIETEFIDIGGGLLMNYLEDEEEWIAFDDHLKKSVLHKAEPITFMNNGLGYESIDEKLHGCLKTYPYFNRNPKSVFLDGILSQMVKGEQKVSDLLRNQNIQLRMEPGRSLLDQCGITLARVISRKEDSNGDLLVGLEMNRTQLCSSSADFLLDPIYLPNSEGRKPRETSVYFTGAYCLEQDIILKRKITLSVYPEIGDMVCFVNTAGYMMHFYESEAHLFNLSTNLVASKDHTGDFTLEED
ncbi:Y4yA family PLP-dependent enzyme [Marinoscillum pacificum]|uniref:Y4yA family PLP-dependent enzyme n=1 Tax=Marinoscillum pacificum TaxID=392723 RepID=UPI00215732FB|nr:Y4yA family PLP-dependent enzyme [Marinoscillum pacificum]